jgi:hypothetical protein
MRKNSHPSTHFQPQKRAGNGFVFGFLEVSFPRRPAQTWVRFTIFTFFASPLPPSRALLDAALQYQVHEPLTMNHRSIGLSPAPFPYVKQLPQTLSEADIHVNPKAELRRQRDATTQYPRSQSSRIHRPDPVRHASAHGSLLTIALDGVACAVPSASEIGALV